MTGTPNHPASSDIVYITQDGTGRWLRITVPHGLISPPTIELHEPLAGPVVFYYASAYGLPVPPGAGGDRS